MKKCVMIAGVALVCGMALMSCTESSDSLTTEERAMKDGRREVQDVRKPPGPPDASMIQDDDNSGSGGSGGD